MMHLRRGAACGFAAGDLEVGRRRRRIRDACSICFGTISHNSSSVHIAGFHIVRIGVGCHARPTMPPATWKIWPLMFQALSMTR